MKLKYVVLMWAVHIVLNVDLLSAQEIPQSWQHETYEIWDGNEIKFDGYSLEYFTFNDGKIRCVNALSPEHEIIRQLCDDRINNRRDIHENLGEVYFLNDALVFSINYVTDDKAEVKVYSPDAVEGEVYAYKWFKPFLNLSASLSTTTITAYPKDSLSFTLKLKNQEQEGVKELYKFYGVAPRGWRIAFKTSSLRASSLELSPGGEASISVELDIPDRDFDYYVISFVADNSDKLMPIKARYSVPIILGEDDALSKLSSSTPEVIVAPGEEVSLGFTLENDGNIEKRYKVIASMPEDWEISFYQGSLEIKSIRVAAGSSVSLTAKIEIPSHASLGEYPITFRAITLKSNSHFDANITVRSKSTSKLQTPTPEIITTPGKEVKLELDLENEGSTDEYYMPKAIAPEDWEVEFYHNEFKVPSVLVKGGKSVALKASVKIPSSTPLGNYTIVFIAKKGNNNNSRLNVTVFVEGEYDLSLELSKLYTRVTAGEAEKVTARVANKGKNPVTEVELEVEVPEGWNYQVAPKKINKIEAQNVADFSLTMYPPPDAGIGDYFIKVKAKSEQDKSDELSLRATVTQKSSMGIAGIAVALLSFVALFAIYRKFGRR